MTEPSSSAQAATVLRLRWSLSGMRRKVWLISGLVVLISLLGLLLSWLDPAIRAPLRPGLDFTGGTQIQLERRCDCLLYTSPSPRDSRKSRMPSSA